MSSNAALLPTYWKVFIDGVEVPHQGFSIQFHKNNLSSCSITLEPDQILTRIRPQSVVSIWANEHFPKDDVVFESDISRVKGTYYLYWEGLTRGSTYSKSPTSRAFILKCESMFSVWRRTKAFMLGIGALTSSPIISGSLAVNPDTIAGPNQFSLNQLAASFTDDSTESSFSNRVIGTVNYLSSLNAVLRLQTVRYQLYSRITEVPDNIFSEFFGLMSKGLVVNAVQQLSETSSVFDVISHLQQYGFYSSYEIPAPVPKVFDKDRVVPSLSKRQSHKFTSTFSRNQLVFLPEMYFALPPPCNFIFPDSIRSLTVDRDFYSEPTRTITPDPHTPASQYAFYLAPSSLLRNIDEADLPDLTGIEIFSQVLEALVVSNGVGDSPYTVLRKGTRRSSLQATTDSELEKGMVVHMDYYPFETLAAVSRFSDLPSSDIETSQVYASFITSVLNYRHQMARYDRGMLIELNGHRDIAPGFPTIVFDSDISYLGVIDSVTTSVDPLGGETTAVTISKARPVTQLDYSRLDELQSEVETLFTQLNSILTKAANSPLEKRRRVEAQARLTTAMSISSLLDGIETDLDIPIPPHFINRKLTDLDSLDEIYQDVLGCQPFYTSQYATDRVPRAFQFLQSSSQFGESAAQLAGLYAYVTGINTLNNVYKMTLTKNLFGGIGANSVASWQDVAGNEDALGVNTYEWTNRNFLARRRLYLGDYLDDHNLVLDQRTSDGVTREFFYIQKLAEGAVDSDGWDDSIFSKLVLEGKPDEVISGLRSSAPDYLKTEVRQQLILEYSTRHFGPRAFDGS